MRAMAAGLVALSTLGGCATGTFRYDRLDEKRDGVSLRGLDELIADGQSGVRGEREEVRYDFTAERDEYLLGRNDVLNVFVVGHPEMSSQRVNMGEISGTTIRKDGMVYLPVIGALPAAGRTITEFESDLRQAAARYVIDPQVNVEILQHASQKFFVMGEVNAPGVFPVDGDTTLLEALALAGGTNAMGSLERATVVRAGELLPINLADMLRRGDVSRNVYMRHGDLVFIPDARDAKIFVLGEVRSPTAVPIVNDRITLAEALAAAGGPEPAKARRELAVLRGGLASPTVYRFDLERALLVDESVVLEPGDRVIVAPTGLATASRYMQQILPFLLSAQAAGLAAQGYTNVAARAVQATIVPAN